MSLSCQIKGMQLAGRQSRMTENPLPRRRFIKMFALATAYSRILDGNWFGTVLAEVNLQPRPTIGILRLNVADFPALLNDFGSVRRDEPLVANVPTGIFYPILINRAPGGQFHALNSECTHAGCAVPTYNRRPAPAPALATIRGSQLTPANQRSGVVPTAAVSNQLRWSEPADGRNPGLAS